MQDEPKGIGFFNIKSGDTHYAKSEAQVQAYINSSDMGINASRGQDFGWRLSPEWVKMVKNFKAEPEKMERLTDRNGGKEPTTPQILYTIYGEQMRVYLQRKRDEDTPFEEEYLQNISSKSIGGVKSDPVVDDVETEKPKSKKQ